MKSLGTSFTGLVIVALFIANGTAQASAYQIMKQGAEDYQQGHYDESLSRFQQAQVESPNDLGVRFNLSSAQYQTGKFDEAIKGFEAVVSRSNDPDLKQKAFYNLGNTAFRKGDFQASSDYYRKALDLDPSDREAKQNLEFVLKKLEKKEQKKSDQDQQGENKEQQPSKSQQEQDQKGQQESSKNSEKNKKRQTASTQSPQDQGEKNERGEIKEAGSKEDRKPGEKQTGAQTNKPLEPGSIAPEEAERLLNTLSNDQRAFLKEQARRFSPKTRSTEKDW